MAKTMINSKNVLLITTEKTFYKSLRKVLGVISNTDVGIASSEPELSDYLKKNVDVLMCKETTRTELYKWLWNEIRIANKSPLPFVALGNNSIDAINIDARDIVFEKKSESHQYIELPYRLTEIIYSISDIQPVNEDLNYLITKFGEWKGIIREILRHEIPNELFAGNENKDNTIILYNIVKELIIEHGKNDESISKRTEELISKVNEELQKVNDCDLDEQYKNLSHNSRNLSEALS